ncbi:MAG: M48 family metallopeptidase [Pseudomonadota bacterium]
MSYSNPRIPEGINVSDVSPLKELVLLCTGAAIVLMLIVVVISSTVGLLAPLIPFSYEERLMAAADIDQFALKRDEGLARERQAYLEELVVKVSERMAVPDDMTIRVHYVDDDVENALATLGGNIVIYKGLMDAMPNENALSMVVAHEIAHVVHRDPIISVARTATLSLVMGLILGVTESSGLVSVISTGVQNGSLVYSREQETEADLAAQRALHHLYGHVDGSTTFFRLSTENDLPAVLLPHTHPAAETRIRDLDMQAAEYGWQLEGLATALPAEVLAADVVSEGSEQTDLDGS